MSFCLILRPTMSFILQPWQLLILILAGWINREQQARTGILAGAPPR